MSTTQIPPGKTVSPANRSARSDGGDLYDANRWESVFREMHDAPALLVKLQDELSYSRQREAFWISVFVHMTIVLLIVNAATLQRYLGVNTVRVVPLSQLENKETTFLELPPDAQKVTKRPDTDRISDKDRIAMSRKPRIDPEELRKIIEQGRQGRPGPSGPPAQQQPPAPQAMAQNQAPQMQPQQQSAPPPPPQTNQAAQLQTPQTSNATPSQTPNFRTGPITAGSAIEQAARAAVANRGAGYGGDGGDYGLGQGRQATKAVGELDVLSDTMGVDFGPYLSRVLHDVRENWYRIIPESARAPMMKKGKVSIEFAILKDGRVAGLTLAGSSGDVALDRAAYGGITASNPFPPLPGEFKGQYLALRFHFFYNPDSNDLR